MRWPHPLVGMLRHGRGPATHGRWRSERDLQRDPAGARIVEQNSYQNGTQQNFLYTGGQANNEGWNRAWIDVSSPSQVYWLNAGVAGIPWCFAIDYQFTIPIQGGATILVGNDAMDGAQVINIDSGGVPMTVANVPGLAQPFDGQWIHFDVVDVQ